MIYVIAIPFVAVAFAATILVVASAITWAYDRWIDRHARAMRHASRDLARRP